MKHFPPIHLSDGDGNSLRCAHEIDGLACGALATVVCSDCGPMCEDCHKDADNFCFSPDGQHRLTAPRFDENKYPVLAVLDALRANRITLENGLQRLRSASAPEYVVSEVLAIERGQRDWDAIFPTRKPFDLGSVACFAIDRITGGRA